QAATSTLGLQRPSGLGELRSEFLVTRLRLSLAISDFSHCRSQFIKPCGVLPFSLLQSLTHLVNFLPGRFKLSLALVQFRLQLLLARVAVVDLLLQYIDSLARFAILLIGVGQV